MMERGSGSHSLRLFNNDVLERFTVVSPLGFVLTWAGMLALALYASWGVADFLPSVGLVAVGLLIWVLFEYSLHRFVFHMKLKSQFGKAMIYLTHGNHHAVPNDDKRNLMPPIVSVTISSGVWALLYAAFGPAGSVMFLGFGIGYVSYDSVHYACHQLPMRAPLLRQLKRHHDRHHYAKRDGNYAITAIFLDRVFGTAIPVNKPVRSDVSKA